ncbi:MAG: Crp/Fnr family transcriptional regulator [Roseovarius sp.]
MALPRSTRDAVLEQCELVEFDARTMLHHVGEKTDAAYFPETAVISVLATYGDGSTIEMANIGREACSGINLTLGREAQLTANEIQVGGSALKLPAKRFTSMLEQDEFRHVMFATVQAVLFQVMVSGACNGAHDARQRLSRWLLTMHDRADGRHMNLTHEFLSHMLGVRRATVSKVAAELREEGLITYSHGRMAVTNHKGLRKASCECYDRVRGAYDTLLPQA